MAKKQNKVFEKLRKTYQDIDREVVKGEDIVLEKIDAEMQDRICKQVNDEFDVAWKDTQARRETNLKRLKVYNNQRKNADAVGDPLLFTVFNTVHAALYDDRLMVNFEGRAGESDEEVEENLNALSKFDYDVMGKNEIDYYWNWDAEFFGRGLLLLMEFDRNDNIMAPVPELIDASTFIRDPRAKTVNGYNQRGDGRMRFGGWEVGATYWDLKNNPAFFNIDSLRKSTDLKSLLDESADARAEAQGRDRNYISEEGLATDGNYEFKLLNWATMIKGEPYIVTVGNQRSSLVRLVKIKDKRWPLLDRPLYPMSQDWDGVSIPDLVEDKQRMRAVLLNLGLKSAKIDAMPQYAYDVDRITNKNELNWKVNKFVGVKGGGDVRTAIAPIQKSQVHQYVNTIMDVLDVAVQKATATPEIQQGVPQEQQRTLGEIQLVSSKVDTRYSMNAKVYGWSEAHFWRQWYQLYKRHFKEGIDEKLVRIQGALKPTWRPLTRENIISHVDPDVRIESRAVSEAQRLREQQSYDAFAAMVMQDPDTNRRFVQKRMAKLRNLSKEEIDMMFPPTAEELHAEQENDLLNNNQMPTIDPYDDHIVHIEIHRKAEENEKMLAHIRLHEKLMIEVRNLRITNPELFAPQEEMQQFVPPDAQQQMNLPQMPEGRPSETTMVRAG